MKWFNDQKIRVKLLISFVLVAALAGVVGIMGVKSLGTLSTADTKLYEKVTVPISDLSDLSTAFNRMRVNMRDAILASNSVEAQQYAEKANELMAEVDKSAGQFEKTLLTAKGREEFKNFSDARDNYNVICKQILDLAVAQKDAEAIKLMWANLPQANAEKVAIDKLQQSKIEIGKQTSHDNQALAASTTRFMISIVIVAVIAAIGLGVFIAKIIGNPIQELSQVADKLSAGDVNVSIKAKSKDEIGDLSRSMDSMLTTLKSLIEEDGGAALEAAAQKDLSIRVQLEYQGVYEKMKNNINALLDALDEALTEVANASTKVAASSQNLSASAEQVGKASQQVAETIGQVAAGSQEQSKTVQTSAQSMEQLTRAIQEIAAGAQSQAKTVEGAVAMVQQSAAAIEQVAKLSQEATANGQQVADVATAGGQQVGEAVNSMGRIKQATDQVAQMVRQLGESSQQIGAIVETIDDIAEQTNLLALNAAIEAARAGEHGKGFAVVADEVRKLAERSSKATGEIAELIGSIQQMTTQAVEAMDKGSRQVDEGAQLGNQAGEALDKIQQAISGIVSQIAEMSAAAQQMSASSSEVIKAIENVSAITEQTTAAAEEMSASSTEVVQQIEQVAAVSEENAAAAEEVSASTEEQNAAVEEMTASAEELARMAQDLQELVGQFKLEDNGGTLKSKANAHRSQNLRRAA